MSTNEKDMAIVVALEITTHALRDLSQQVAQMDSFLRTNYRQYNGYMPNLYSRIDEIARHVNRIQQLSATNKDNVHCLEREG